ncbi:hypothetical protein F5X68DRAFT_57742 [Plectosphaerella plurivora]|uniref:Meiotically up-regulated protein Msb1/Mug8 domain-containing protein n=1 Tax=Plectosphaerella plurivora TaxID=936078 RepID=A0A9P8VH40_9PEZI|nr:hypothetical protein F5X68DRAFT_57742 [Plectosphaerella plurivora]
MPSLFSRLKGKDGKSKKKGANNDDISQLPVKPKWTDAYARTSVEPEEIQELIRRCTEELKARALDHPFLLLPFRPTSDPSAVRTFIRHFFDNQHQMRGEQLAQDLRMTEPMVIAGVAKWCWGRLQGGVVGWDAYELFKVGEHDSNMARDSFKTFIPLSVENGARSCIIFDFFDLIAAIAAHGKMNGLGGRKLSRMAAWWAFEQKDTGSGFEGGYNAWAKAADATSHLFFAYLRSLAPKQTQSTISMLPMSLQKLLQETEYPPHRPTLTQSSTYKVVMIVDAVSPTPFALLRRANHFQYRDEDRALQEFSDFQDPITALTEECRRVLKSISSANQSQVSSSKHSTSLRDASWSRFEDIGFASALDDDEDDDDRRARRKPMGLRTTPASGTMDLGRPTTPSWADFLSSGFVDDSQVGTSSHLLPPDKVLPPIDINVRQKSSQSHAPRLETDGHLEPGELASITRFNLDEAFWWVWMSSLAPEETADRKSAFGRCAVVETVIRSGRWLVMEEMVVGAAPEPQEGAYIAEKKGFFSWTRRNKGVSRSKSTGKKALDQSANSTIGMSKTSIGPDQQAKIAAAAAQLQARQQREQQSQLLERRGRNGPDGARDKTASIMTLQPAVVKEASPAMKWASKYDKDAIREAYLANSTAGRGTSDLPSPHSNSSNGFGNGHAASHGYELRPDVPAKDAPTPSSMLSPALPTGTSQRFPDEEPAPIPTEKDLEAPPEAHPSDRAEASGRVTPLPPAKESLDQGRANMFTPEPEVSPEGKKHKKLQKDKTAPGGLRKFFGRRNRGSKLPDNAAADVNTMLAQQEARGAPSPVPVDTPQRRESPAPEQPTPAEAFVTPMEQPSPGPSPPTHQGQNLSRVNTADAHEAQQEFSRFDQGPLEDQPAFVPDEDSDDDATPPPIARHAKNSNGSSPVTPVDESGPPFKPLKPVNRRELPPPEAPALNPAQDRWAQIRKNAAERAAQRQSEEQSHGGKTAMTDDGDDTSGEETIESRVARIKARVAELTGNMEGSTSPVPPGPPRRY